MSAFPSDDIFSTFKAVALMVALMSDVSAAQSNVFLGIFESGVPSFRGHQTA